MKTNNIYLPNVIGKGYGAFWRFKGRYRVCKGSRASKKSKTTGLWYIYNLCKYPLANLLVIRKTYRTLRNSCYKELKWAIHRLGLDADFKCNEATLEITRISTGQKIYFAGLDDPLKITSITVDVGVLCWVWIEEAYEITKEADFDMLDESIRGIVPDGYFKQITITFNPWNERHWLRTRFFESEDENGKVTPIVNDDILAITTNYMCNEWLDEADKRVFERMKQGNPRRYQVAGLGNWGIVDGLVYENWREEKFVLMSKKDYDELEEKPDNVVIKDNLQSAFGLDFGYTNDPSALFCGLIDKPNKKLYVFDEMYQKGLSNKAIYNNVVELGYTKEQITGDSAEPKSIDELRGYGLRISAAKKGKDSIQNGIQFIQDFEIIIHPRCVNFLTEISNYTWQVDKQGKKLNTPEDANNHLMDAMRYGIEKYIKESKWLF